MRGSALSNSFYPDENFSILSHLSLIKPNYMVDKSSQHSPLSLNDQLRVMTDHYLKKHPGLSLNALSQRCGVPATTMRRLMQEEGRTELAPHSVLALVSYLLKEKKISKILKMVEGPVYEVLNKCFDQFIFDEEKSDHKLDSDLNSALQDKTAYLIYKMCANVSGSTVLNIKNSFGLMGLKKLDELIEKNWIIIDQKTSTLHAREKNFSLDLALAHQLSHALLDQYKPSDVKLGHNLFYSLSEGMNEAGIKKIKEIEKEAVKKIYDLMNNKDYQGNLPYFALILSDLIGALPESEESNQHGVLQ